MPQRTFTGFSTVDSARTRQRTFYDLELCKRDLRNHFFTRIGERVMRPDWGCAIWDYIMEPLTSGIRQRIADEATRVVQSDDRCRLVGIDIQEIDHGVVVAISIDFDPLGVVDTMILNFERREAVRWDGGI